MIQVFLFGLLLGSSPPGAPECATPVIGHVQELQGNWFDDRIKQSLVKGSEVCADSLLVRRGETRDSDRLSIAPLKANEPPVVFLCREGVTCLAPLNVNRVPVATASGERLDDFLTFLRRAFAVWESDRERVANLTHRGAQDGDLRDGIVLSVDGTIAPGDFFSTAVTPPLWLEFCRVRPGDSCTDPPNTTTWKAPSDRIKLGTGFFKVVVGSYADGRYLRTGRQAYILVVDNEQQRSDLKTRFDTAEAQAYEDYTQWSRANAVTYLFYLGGGYGSRNR